MDLSLSSELNSEVRDPAHMGASCRLWYNSMAEHLLSMYKVLGSILSATNKRICQMLTHWPHPEGRHALLLHLPSYSTIQFIFYILYISATFYYPLPPPPLHGTAV